MDSIRGITPTTLTGTGSPPSRPAMDAPLRVPTESVAVGSTPPPLVAGATVAAASPAMAVAASLAGAPVAPLSDPDLLAALQLLESRGVEFDRDRAFHIPVLQDKAARVDPATVLKTLQAHEEKTLSVRAPESERLPLRDRAAVPELLAFYAGGDVRALCDASLGSLLRDLQMDGYQLREGSGKRSEAIGPYGAYNALTSAWSGESDVPTGAWVWRGGVPLLPLPKDAGARPAEVRDAIRQSKVALEALQAKAATDANARQDLAALQPAVGDASFATRADVLARLQQKGRSGGNPRVDYGMIAHTLRPGEKLEDVAAFYLDVVSKNSYADTRDLQGAFNYIRSNFAQDPVLAKSFLDLYGVTHDINVCVRAVDLLRRPVGSETYDERQKAFVEMAQEEGHVTRDDHEGGRQALNHYAYVVADIRPGETFAQVSGDWLAVLKGLRQADTGLGQAVPTFRYIRDQLGTDPQRREWFRDAFAQVGTLEQSKRAVEFIDTQAVADPKTRATVLLGLLRNTHGMDDAQRYFGQIAASLQPGEDFGAAGGIMTGLMDDLRDSYGRWSGGDLDKAYAFCRQNLASDPATVGLFHKVVQHEKSYEKALDAYPALRPAVRGESEADRVDAFLALSDLVGWYDNAAAWYGTVSQNLLSGETLKDGVAQFQALTKAIREDRDGEDDPEEAFVELKQRHAANPDEVRLFTRLCDGLGSYQDALAGRQVLDRPLQGEDLKAREDEFFRLVDLEKSAGGEAREAAANYETLRDDRVASEDVSDATARFVALRTAVKGKQPAADARDAFHFITENLKNGAIKDRTANEVTAEMVESLLLNGDLNAAKNRALAPRNGGGTIEKQDGWVIIGGIKVPVAR